MRMLGRLNPEVVVEPIVARVDGERLAMLVAGADVVLDCSDNFATRHAVNRACVAASVPLVSGAAIRFDGQIASFDLRPIADEHRRAPCYACLFPECDAVEVMYQSRASALAAKLLMNLPTLSGRLLLLDALRMEWQTIALPRDPACSVCGPAGTA